MQLSVSLPDAQYPSVVCVVTEDSLVSEIAAAAAAEWGLAAGLLELLYEGDILPPDTTIMSHGIQPDTNLDAVLTTIITREVLENLILRHKVHSLIKKNGVLRVDTRTFDNGHGILTFPGREGVLDHVMTNICLAHSSPAITTVGSNFLWKSAVTRVDLVGLQYVTTIADNFLKECTALQTVNLTALSSVTSIGDGFLNSSSITSLNTAGLANVVSVGSHFLRNCSSLTYIDLSGLPSLEAISSHFLSDCSRLQSVDMSSLTRLTSIDDFFFADSPGLTNLDTTGLINVTSVGSYFLNRSTSLASFDLIDLCNLTSIDRGFLNGCCNLTSLDLSLLSNVVSVGDMFLAGVCIAPLEVEAFNQAVHQRKITNEPETKKPKRRLCCQIL